ncbi:desulfoferrodoxin [bacterium]|nr:desulfoferrodoxin [bacterium]
MALKQLEVYRCDKCGAIVEMMNDAEGKLVCCGLPMKLQAENSTDAAGEKHVPVIQQTADGVVVTVGTVLHPMLAEHFIEWIELIVDGQLLRKQLQPGDKPEARFCATGNEISARAWCNLHGLWRA